MAKKQGLFDEIMDGVAAMRAHRTGKITLRTYKVEPRVLPEVKPRMIKRGRAKPNA
jgi:putative transcriptional regulator